MGEKACMFRNQTQRQLHEDLGHDTFLSIEGDLERLRSIYWCVDLSIGEQLTTSSSTCSSAVSTNATHHWRH
jgi:hypothetical protein